jgi:hypothetical protein
MGAEEKKFKGKCFLCGRILAKDKMFFHLKSCKKGKKFHHISVFIG